MTLKAPIPYVDLRGQTPIELLRAYPDKAQALIKAARQTYGTVSKAASALALPFADKRSHEWLKRTGNPYLYEIETFADILGVRGVYALNLAYEWGCTSGAYPTHETVTLLRVLDWPFPALGKNVMVVLQQGRAGEFYNITWPAVSGVYTAMAPGRFSAALNQAPMRRHNLTHAGDWFRNRLRMRRESGLPPAHLLRQVFEQAKSYQDAKRILSETKLAMPVIYILAGTRPGEGCIIERLEDQVEIIDLGAGQQVSAANHFNSSLMSVGPGWRPRALDSRGRYWQSSAIHGHDVIKDNFDWLQGPIINQFTRLAVACDAVSGRLMVQGFEGANRVTELFNLPLEAYEKRQVI